MVGPPVVVPPQQSAADERLKVIQEMENLNEVAGALGLAPRVYLKEASLKLWAEAAWVGSWVISWMAVEWRSRHGRCCFHRKPAFWPQYRHLPVGDWTSLTIGISAVCSVIAGVVFGLVFNNYVPVIVDFPLGYPLCY